MIHFVSAPALKEEKPARQTYSTDYFISEILAEINKMINLKCNS